MLNTLVRKVVGSKNERYLKSIRPLVDKINGLEPDLEKLADAELQTKVAEYRQEIDNGRSLDDALPEVFALTREGSKRVFGMRHYDVQLIGGMVLHSGQIAEMKTGEGKTLMATLPVTLNALAGKGVHVVTVNDYLARRDAEWMGELYSFLGLSTGNIIHGLTDEQRQQSYAADITYGTNNEYGFDYLRDNMKFYKEQLVQRDLNFCIVDEVDSILIDEARTPLIISGPAETSTGHYVKINTVIPGLKDEAHYSIDEKAKSVVLTEDGTARVEELLGIDNLYDPANVTFQHHVLQALKAHKLFRKDVDYVVKEGQVVIVDEFTGRLMPGRRFSDGLHQALEAKEGVKVEAENQTLASITFQNFFRMYDKLAGMTGTADTEAVEFKEIYDLEVTVIPTHRPMIRKDHPDAIFKNQEAKYKAIAKSIKEMHSKGQPVLVGTVSIEKSELLSNLLKKQRIPHNVLNAKNHEKEAEIVAEAGQHGKVTIATNMAGRGTDIKVAKAELELGGLHVLGTERHESRRIDNQLRGRTGRQGDPGSSRFYLALDDDLMRLFGSAKLEGLMGRLGMEDDEPIENNMVSKAIENAQKRVEGHNFEIRKQLLDFDNVMNQQREVIYTQRRELMTEEDVDPIIMEFMDDLLEEIYAEVEEAKGEPEQESVEIAAARLEEIFSLAPKEQLAKALPPRDDVHNLLTQRIETLKAGAPDHFTEICRYFLLDSLDRNWKDHLLNMDHLREGIGLRGYGQKDPKQEYKREGFNLFQEMLWTIKESSWKAMARLRLKTEVDEERFREEFRHQDTLGQSTAKGAGDDKKPKSPVKRDQPKVGRNDPCPCGSGKKHKKCCGS